MAPLQMHPVHPARLGSGCDCSQTGAPASNEAMSLCPSPHQVVPGKPPKGRDSELLQAVQWRLLSLLREEAPQALYPAALCALADLQEVEAQNALDEALERGDGAAITGLLERRPGDARELFERAITAAAASAPHAAEAAVAEAGAAAADGGALTAPEQQQAAEDNGARNTEERRPGPAVPAATTNGSTEAAAAAAAAAKEPTESEPDPGWLWYPHRWGTCRGGQGRAGARSVLVTVQQVLRHVCGRRPCPAILWQPSLAA